MGLPLPFLNCYSVHINEFAVLILILDSYQLAIMLESCYSSLIMLGKRERCLKLKPKQQIHLCAHCNNLKKEMVSKHEKELTFTPPFHMRPDRPIHNMDVHIQLILCKVLFKYSTSIIGMYQISSCSQKHTSEL